MRDSATIFWSSIHTVCLLKRNWEDPSYIITTLEIKLTYDFFWDIAIPQSQKTPDISKGKKCSFFPLRATFDRIRCQCILHMRFDIAALPSVVICNQWDHLTNVFSSITYCELRKNCSGNITKPNSGKAFCKFLARKWLPSRAILISGTRLAKRLYSWHGCETNNRRGCL